MSCSRTLHGSLGGSNPGPLTPESDALSLSHRSPYLKRENKKCSNKTELRSSTLMKAHAQCRFSHYDGTFEIRGS